MRSLILFPLLVGLAACTARGYGGPELPKEQISKITFANSSQDLSVSAQSVDSLPVPILADSLEVLPGPHSVSVDYSVVSRRECTSYDYECLVTTAYGTCEGHLSTMAGRAYLVTIREHNAYVDASILAKSYFDFSVRADEQNIGSISCRSTHEEDSYERNPDREQRPYRGDQYR